MFPCIKDVFPSKAQYVKDEPIGIEIELDNPTQHKIKVRVEAKIMELNRVIKTWSRELILIPNIMTTQFFTRFNIHNTSDNDLRFFRKKRTIR